MHLKVVPLMWQFAGSKELQQEWAEAKMARKEKLAAYLLAKTGYTVSPKALFDIQVCAGFKLICLKIVWRE